MKSLVLILIVVLISVSYSQGSCPEGEYYPGPACDSRDIREPEPVCPPKSSHNRPSFSCCWCNTGTFRQILTGKCVKLDDCYKD